LVASAREVVAGAGLADLTADDQRTPVWVFADLGHTVHAGDPDARALALI